MSGEQGQTPQNVAQQIDQTVAEHRLQHTVQNVLQVFSPAAASAYGAAQRATAAPTPGGGGYQFSPGEIDTAIRKFEDIRDRAKALGTKLQDAAANIGPPAPDGPSTRETIATRESIQKAHDHNSALHNYADRFLGKLHKAKEDYTAAEDANASNAGRQTP